MANKDINGLTSNGQLSVKDDLLIVYDANEVDPEKSKKMEMNDIQISKDDRWGDGSIQVQLFQLFTNLVDTGGGVGGCRVTAKDMIRSLSCDSSASLAYNIIKAGGSFGSDNADPNAVYIDFNDTELGPQVITVRVTDGVIPVDQDCFVTIQDPLGLAGAP